MTCFEELAEALQVDCFCVVRSLWCPPSPEEDSRWQESIKCGKALADITDDDLPTEALREEAVNVRRITALLKRVKDVLYAGISPLPGNDGVVWGSLNTIISMKKSILEITCALGKEPLWSSRDARPIHNAIRVHLVPAFVQAVVSYHYVAGMDPREFIARVNELQGELWNKYQGIPFNAS